MRTISSTPPAPCGARLEHLVGVDEEVLAHGRHAVRMQDPRRDAQVIEAAVEP
jgi:hypothetical protein